MNTLMWQNPVTTKQMKKLKALSINILHPVEKKLACNDVGFGAMARVDEIIEHVKKNILRAMIVKVLHKEKKISKFDLDLQMKLLMKEQFQQQVDESDIKSILNELITKNYVFVSEADLLYAPYPQSKLF